LGGGLHSIDGHTEVTREHGRNLRDRAEFAVLSLDLIGLDGALAVLTEDGLALRLGEFLKKRANIRIAAAANLAEAGDLDPLALAHLLLDGDISRKGLHIVDNEDIERTIDVITRVDGHGGGNLSLLDNDVVGGRITAVGDGEVDRVKLLKRLHFPSLKSANSDKNSTSKDKATHFNLKKKLQKNIKKVKKTQKKTG